MSRLVRIIGYRYVTAALVLLAVAAVYGVAQFSRPAAALRPAGITTTVTTALVACPAPSEGRVSLLSSRTGATGGQVQITQTRDGAAVGAVQTAGVAWSKDIGTVSGAYTVRADGALAPGLEVEQTTVEAKGADRGLATTRCAEPGTDHWFLGPGPVDAKDIELYLTNVDDQPAAVDLEALSGEGPLDTVDGRGTTVDPHSSKTIAIGESQEGLGEIVNNARLLALHVRATTGRVAAAIRVRAGNKKGIDWEPPAPAPATSVVVPGVYGGKGKRRLLVAVPGEADARVKVQVIATNGAFAPEGQDTLEAPASTVTPLDLQQALSGRAAAVRLTSDRPIIAGLATERGDEVAFGAAAPPIGPGGAVADNRLTSTLVLTAPDAAATVRITAVTSNGPAGAAQDVKIAAGRTVETKVSAPAAGAGGFGLQIVPAPGSGPVYAARLLSTTEQITLLPVQPALATVTLPPVAESQTSLVP